MKLRILYFALLFAQASTVWSQQRVNQAVLIFIDQTVTDSEEVAYWQADWNASLDRLRNPARRVRDFAIRYQPIHAYTKTATSICDEEFSGRKEIKHRMLREKKILQMREALKSVYPVPARYSQVIAQTDILSSIGIAIDFFRAHPNHSKELVYYSDMIQFYTDMKLLQDRRFRDNQLNALVDEIMQRYQWREPGLRGVHIRIIKPGTRYGSRVSHSLTAVTVDKIDRFWTMLFSRLGAKIG